MEKSWSSYSKAEKDFGIAISKVAPHSHIAAADLQGLRLAIDALAPDLPRGERAHDLPRSRDQDPDFSGVSDPLTARGALHSHLASCIDDPDARLVAHQLVDQLCAAYGGGAEDDPPDAFSVRTIEASRMRQNEALKDDPGSNNGMPKAAADQLAADRWCDDFFRRASRPTPTEKPLAADASIERRIKRIVDGIVDPQKRAAEARAASKAAHDQAFDEWRATAMRNSRGDAAYHQLAADQARGVVQRGKTGSEALSAIFSEFPAPPEV